MDAMKICDEGNVIDMRLYKNDSCMSSGEYSIFEVDALYEEIKDCDIWFVDFYENIKDANSAEFIDVVLWSDEFIENITGRHPSVIINEDGIDCFRDIEADAIARLSAKGGMVIATGGGAVLRKENISRLKRNGRIYFINRALEDIIPTDDRPLSSSRKELEKRYAERYDIYCATADEIIKSDNHLENTIKQIIKE
jgi:shikimate kinase